MHDDEHDSEYLNMGGEPREEPDWCERNPGKMWLIMLGIVLFTVFAALMGWVGVGCERPPETIYVYVDSLGHRYVPIAKVDTLQATLARVGAMQSVVRAQLDSCLEGGPSPLKREDSVAETVIEATTPSLQLQQENDR